VRSENRNPKDEHYRLSDCHDQDGIFVALEKLDKELHVYLLAIFVQQI
jgi:hypothetical protein